MYQLGTTHKGHAETAVGTRQAEHLMIGKGLFLVAAVDIGSNAILLFARFVID